MQRRASSETIAKINRSNHYLITGVVITAFILISLAILTFAYILRITMQLEQDVGQHREQTEKIIQDIKKENETSHGELLKFVKCILEHPAGQRTQADINQCVADTNIPLPPDKPVASYPQSTPTPATSNGTSSNSNAPAPTQTSDNTQPTPPPNLLQTLSDAVKRFFPL